MLLYDIEDTDRSIKVICLKHYQKKWLRRHKHAFNLSKQVQEMLDAVMREHGDIPPKNSD